MGNSLKKSLMRFLHWGPFVAIGKKLIEHLKMNIVDKVKLFHICCLYMHQVRLCIDKQMS